ncbi:MAG: hypothetical protein ACYC0V_03495 [Armatimonadota bacterium]
MNTDNTEQNRPESPLTSRPATLIVIIVVIAIITALVAVLVPVLTLSPDGHGGRATTCLSNTKSLASSFWMYMAENDDRMPPGSNWLEAVGPYIKSRATLKCPSAQATEPCYAFNSKLAKTKVSDVTVPDKTVMLFETVPGTNQCGGKELLPSPPRHLEGHSIGFVDGHVGSVPLSGINSLIWSVKTPPEKTVNLK